ncbi:S17A5 protein, partial [Polypterus senegalus]
MAAGRCECICMHSEAKTFRGWPGVKKGRKEAKKNIRDRLILCKRYRDWTAEVWSKVIFSDDSPFRFCGASGKKIVQRRKGGAQHVTNIPLVPLAGSRQCCSARWNLSFLMFLGFGMVYALRVNLSVAMVAMVNGTAPQPVDNSTYLAVCPDHSTDNSSNTSRETLRVQQFQWDSTTQGVILSSFFYGYILTQVPGGYLAGYFGGKLFLGLGVLVTAVLTLLTPLAASLGVPYLVILRALEGFGEGVTYPAMNAMWAKWAPPLERSRLMTFSGTGSLLPAAFFIATAFIDCDYVAAMVFLTVSSTLIAANSAGFSINHIDIAPRYAGVLLGITNTFGTLPGMIAPTVVGYLTAQNALAGWKIVFYISAAILTFGGVFYTAFGSGEPQVWSKGIPEGKQRDQKSITSPTLINHPVWSPDPDE